jgi:hypothetical protein
LLSAKHNLNVTTVKENKNKEIFVKKPVSRSASIKDMSIAKPQNKLVNRNMNKTSNDIKAVTVTDRNYLTLSNLNSKKQFESITSKEAEYENKNTKNEFIQNKYRTLINGFLK